MYVCMLHLCGTCICVPPDQTNTLLYSYHYRQMVNVVNKPTQLCNTHVQASRIILFVPVVLWVVIDIYVRTGVILV